MKIFTKTPSFSIPATTTALVLFIKGTIKLQEIVQLYAHVSNNKIEQYTDQEYVVGNLKIQFRLEEEKILIQSANFEKPNMHEKYYNPSIHFLSRMLERELDFNIFIPLYKYVIKFEDIISNGTEIEIASPNASIVFVKYENTVKLLTGWPGSRHAS